MKINVSLKRCHMYAPDSAEFTIQVDEEQIHFTSEAVRARGGEMEAVQKWIDHHEISKKNQQRIVSALMRLLQEKDCDYEIRSIEVSDEHHSCINFPS